jgi:hypothetical protein
MSDEAQDRSRDEARERSRGCPHCGGAGLATVFHPRYDGFTSTEVELVDHGGEVVRRDVPARVSAHCICPMGEWMRGKTDLETIRRIPNLLDVLAGRSRWLARDPTGLTPAAGPRDLEAMKRGVMVKVGKR